MKTSQPLSTYFVIEKCCNVRKDVHGIFGDGSSAMLGLVLVTENQISFSKKAL